MGICLTSSSGITSATFFTKKITGNFATRIPSIIHNRINNRHDMLAWHGKNINSMWMLYCKISNRIIAKPIIGN